MKAKLVVLAALLATSHGALAQDQSAQRWPERNVRLIVPFPAGSATDVAMRVLEPGISSRLGQSLVVDNRAGASGSIGVDAVAKAPPDGYMAGLVTVSTQAIAASLGRKLPYDPMTDFAPIGMVGSTPYVLVAYPGLGAATVPQLIEIAKKRPRELNYGSAGPGSMAHLAAALLATRAGIELVHVPYRSTAHAVTDIIAGRIQLQFATIPPSIELITTGRLKALAVSSAGRSSTLPNVPALGEHLQGFEAVLWMGLVLPRATPKAIVDRFNSALNDTLKDPKVKAALLVQGLEVEPGPADALTKRTQKDTATWREVIAKAGIKSE